MLGFHGISVAPISALATALGAITGTISVTFSTAGVLTGVGSLAGVTTLTFTTTATGQTLHGITGVISLTFTTAGNLLQPSSNIWLNPDGLILVFGTAEGKTYPSVISPLSIDLPGKLRYDQPNPFKFRRMK